MFRKTVLENKLRLITAPMKGTNTVTVLVMCGTGSDNESKNLGGISHFLEHMFFKGTKKRPTPQQIMQETDEMGAISNAFTTHEYTGYFIKAGKLYLDHALELLADVYQNSLLKEKEVEREKQVIVEELQRDRDTPTMYIWWLWEKLLYGNHQSAGKDIIGTEKEIRSFSAKDLQQYFAHQYTSKNTVVIVAGNIDEARVITRVQKLFGDIRSFKPKPTSSFRESQKKPELDIFYKETDQSHVLLGFRGFPIGHKDRFVVDLLETLTGGSHSSRMFDAVRERKGLAYTVYTGSQAYSNRGYFTTYAGVSHSNTVKVIATMLEVYRGLAERPVSAKELQRAKDHLKGTSLIQLEASNSVAYFYGSEELETGRPLTIEEVLAKIEEVTEADIERVAKALFTKDRLNLAIIGPHKEKDKFEKLLK